MVGRRRGGRPRWSGERVGRPEEQVGRQVEDLGRGEVPICEIILRVLAIGLRIKKAAYDCLTRRGRAR